MLLLISITKYIQNRNNTVSIIDKEYNIVTGNENPYDYKNHALTSSNFTFNTSNIYKQNGKYYIDITIYIKSKSSNPFCTTKSWPSWKGSKDPGNIARFIMKKNPLF